MQFDTGFGTVSVNVADFQTLEDLTRARLRDGTGFALATLNLDHLVKLRTDADFANAYDAQDFVVADGNPVVWLARLAGHRLSLQPGSDLILPLTRIATEEGKSIALLGTTEAALEAAAAVLQRAVPGADVVFKIAPPRGFDVTSAAAEAMLKEVEASGAGLCFLALGAPKQEKLAARGRSLAPSVGFASIGAGLDFLAGHQKRAPLWVRKLALEWLWRMLENPARLTKRYLMCFVILPGHFLSALKKRIK